MVVDEASQPAKAAPPPPPSYSESVAADSSTRTVPPSAAQYHYGPTPINAETGAMLHSYDVAQAMEQADRRALLRFVGALLVALVVYALVGILLGGLAEDVRGRG